MRTSPLLAFAAALAFVSATSSSSTTMSQPMSMSMSKSMSKDQSQTMSKSQMQASPQAEQKGNNAACHKKENATVPKAIYMMTNKKPNSIVAISIGKDGKISQGKLISTGGNGGNVVSNKTAVLGDALSSQGSVEIIGKKNKKFIFVVNAGSNSVTMFSIDPKDPTKLTMVGKPAVTTGDFPTSVAPSLHLGVVCAAHTGAKAGISCAKFSKKTGIGKFDSLRPFDLKQTNPPSGPLNGVGDCFFTDDSSALITTVKGDPSKKNNGFISIFTASRFQSGIVSEKGTQSSPSGTSVLFGAAHIPHTTKIFATDASFGFTIIDLKEGNVAVRNKTEIKGQSATCWAKLSRRNETLGFVTDVGVNSLVSVNIRTGQQIEEFKSKNGNKGMIDFVVAGTMVYALSPGKKSDGTGASIAVFTVTDAGKIVDAQNIAIKGADGNAQGMAALM